MEAFCPGARKDMKANNKAKVVFTIMKFSLDKSTNTGIKCLIALAGPSGPVEQALPPTQKAYGPCRVACGSVNCQLVQ